MNIESHIKSFKIPEHKKALINIIYSANYIDEKINNVLKPFDISIQQFNVLRILKGQKGKPANLSTIQERMVTKMSNTTRLVDKLIDKKLVNRKVCPENRRKVEISITKKGEDFLNKLNASVESKELEMTNHLKTKNLEQINKLLNQLRQ
ncbi:MarR family winged helix-turn-helix transcriptional regulator [Flavobacterium sp. CS20]|uniref:MarR family winged helix-turn-helix transcriptional regulator n=1 Tax=Flavobacterium sp. CS20 TaxID=2775246 RepID=UPI001B3A7A44|nr:MarR family transcriptional regulator [Flavobacterium sp. CS20]QTY28255.1 MarR family transcriptional regulator [Flavobacterium sp. CS20]